MHLGLSAVKISLRLIPDCTDASDTDTSDLQQYRYRVWIPIACDAVEEVSNFMLDHCNCYHCAAPWRDSNWTAQWLIPILDTGIGISLVKINRICKSNMAAGRHLDSWKIWKSWYLCNHLTDFTEIGHGNASQCFASCQPLKNPRWGMSDILKIAIFQQPFDRIHWNFCCNTH